MSKTIFQRINLILASCLILACNQDNLQVDSLYCENKQEAFGVMTTDFRLSWKITSTKRNVLQMAYRICLADNEDNLTEDRALIWNSGIIENKQSILVSYDGPVLDPGSTYYFKVKVWDNHGDESPWSETAKFTTGLFSEMDWEEARWIAYDELKTEKRIVPGIHMLSRKDEWEQKDSGNHILPLFRRDFSVKKNLEQALVFVSGLGHYELYLNGQKVGTDFLTPGWTDYDSCSFYNTYDITNEVMAGKNALGIMLGNGFYIVPNSGYRKLITAYGNPKMILKLQLIYQDGSSETVVSDEKWKTSESPITYSSIFAGETYDARLEQDGWDSPGFNGSQWKDALIVNAPLKNLLPEMDYPLKICDILEVKTIRLIDQSEKSFLYDFGQNASGIIELAVKGTQGDTIRMIPGELIRENLEAEQKASGGPFYFTYILKGDGIEIWRPRFTYYGFRYVQVEGAVPDSSSEKTDLPRIISLKFLHTRNSAPEQGTFSTSFDLFNRINWLIKWAIRSNLQSVVTDCPHREKLGWLEQTYLMGEGIHYNYDIYHLYNKLIDDMITAQTAEGLVPDIVPEYTEFSRGFRDSPEWGSAAVILPWLVYKWYGDFVPMEKAWTMMTRYVEYLNGKSDDHILSHGLGDWYDLGPKHPGPAQLTPRALTATAIYYYDVVLLSEMAGILGKKEEIHFYKQWSEEIKQAFNNEFFDPDIYLYSTGSQTAIAMPLAINLVPEDMRSKVEKTLIESINNSGKVLTAGDVGFHFLVRALYDAGADNVLFEMNARDDVPGYGFQLKKGATALTESWAALEWVSNNHLMLGHLMEWFYAGLGGISQTENSIAYKEVLIAPRIIDAIESAEATFESPYGRIVSQWEKCEGTLEINIQIPVNSTAIVKLPLTAGQTIYESGKPVSESEEIQLGSKSENLVTLRVGSGKYRFILK